MNFSDKTIKKLNSLQILWQKKYKKYDKLNFYARFSNRKKKFKFGGKIQKNRNFAAKF